MRWTRVRTVGEEKTYLNTPYPRHCGRRCFVQRLGLVKGLECAKGIHNTCHSQVNWGQTKSDP